MVADADHSDVLDWGLVETLRAFDEHPAPVIASIRGACLGGGLEIALACDLVVAPESAKIGCVEATVGLHPLMGAVQRITQLEARPGPKRWHCSGDATRPDLERWKSSTSSWPDEQPRRRRCTIAQELAHGPPSRTRRPRPVI